MKLPVLQAPARGEGCVDRSTIPVKLGDLGTVDIIVSGCQLEKFEAGIAARVAEQMSGSSDPAAIQAALQSWIDGGSPCDSPYARRQDRTDPLQALLDELRRKLGPQLGSLPRSPFGLLVVVTSVRPTGE